MTVPEPTNAYLVALAVMPSCSVEETCAVVGLVVSAVCSVLRLIWVRNRSVGDSQSRARRRKSRPRPRA